MSSKPLARFRIPAPSLSRKKTAFACILVFLIGLAFGVGAKVLDSTPSNVFPVFFENLDLRNFFSRISIWVFLGTVVSVLARNPRQAALHVFLFFLAMLVGYFGYTMLFLHFYPWKYSLVWAAITIVSPVLGYLCWYAKGKGWLSFLLSSVILSLFFRSAFSIGWLYIDLSYPLELVVWIAGGFLLYRSPKQFVLLLGASALLGIALGLLVPYI